jgi:hypothetical protein
LGWKDKFQACNAGTLCAQRVPFLSALNRWNHPNEFLEHPVYRVVINLLKHLGSGRFGRCAVLTLGLLLLVHGASAQSRFATLRAIHLLENPTNRSTPGPYGELGPYQFRSAVWYKYSQTPFRHALNRQASDYVAVCHYEWLKDQIESHGLSGSAYNIALAWNGGLGAVLRGHSPRAARDYAQRASNLARSFDETTASQ